MEDKGLKVKVGKTKMMVSGTEGEKFLSKIDPCGICGKRVGSNTVCCTQCTKWIHGRCKKMKKVPAVLQDILFVEDAQMLEMARKNQWRYYVMKWRP